MNENLPLQALTINNWLDQATKLLADVGVTSARLDAEIILSHTMRVGRTYLHAHAEDGIDDRIIEIANARIDLRTDRVPVAYIIGHKEFYGRRFYVNTATLIPRPESEDVINLLTELLPASLYHLPSTKLNLVDVGTGSGNLGITAKLEYSKLQVSLLDISTQALSVAERNANQLKADVTVIQSDLLTNYPFTPDIILANLPYVDIEWERSPETEHEPPIALFASSGGKAIIEKLIDTASSAQRAGNLIIIEADPEQHQSLIEHAKIKGYKLVNKIGYAIAFIKLR